MCSLNCAQVTKAYRVYYSKGPEEAEGDYQVDHTIIMYLLGPDGTYLDLYGSHLEANEVALKIKKQVDAVYPWYTRLLGVNG